MCFISGIIATRTIKVSKDGIEDKRLDYLIVSRAYEDHHGRSWDTSRSKGQPEPSRDILYHYPIDCINQFGYREDG